MDGKARDTAMRLGFKRRLEELRMVVALAKFLKEPDQLESIFKVASSVKESELSNYMKDTLKGDPLMRELISARWQPPKRTLEELRRLPEGTLGNAYANQLISLQLSPEDLLPKGEIRTERDYLELRARQTHDIMHAITGFKTDKAGEIGLQAFNLAQIKSPVSALIIFGAILTALKRKSDFTMDDLLAIMTKGFTMGRNAEILLTKKLEDEWGTDIGELRKKYQIEVS